MALSKIIFQGFVTPMSIYVVIELKEIQKSFLWENSTSKIKQDTHDGLKNVDIRKKNISLLCS